MMQKQGAKKPARATARKQARGFTFRAVIHEAEEGGYWAEVPGFPGCVSEGDTLEEVRANIREAFTGVLEVMQDRGAASGQPGRVEEVEL
jgi:predicted RNase H-like HicB family nuclease